MNKKVKLRKKKQIKQSQQHLHTSGVACCLLFSSTSNRQEKKKKACTQMILPELFIKVQR
jgi:hypothetical protein